MSNITLLAVLRWLSMVLCGQSGHFEFLCVILPLGHTWQPVKTHLTFEASLLGSREIVWLTFYGWKFRPIGVHCSMSYTSKAVEPISSCLTWWPCHICDHVLAGIDFLPRNEEYNDPSFPRRETDGSATWEHLNLPLLVCASSQLFKVFPQNFHFVWYWIFNLGPVCSLALRFQTLWRSFLLEVNEQIQPVQTSSFRLNGKAGTLSLLFFWGSSVTFNDFSFWVLTTPGASMVFQMLGCTIVTPHVYKLYFLSICMCIRLIQNWLSTAS